ncbi:cation transporter [Streptomyces sp. NPDC006265]|uniref:cation transporter n=1 Tax=Streptomyces sp. NPDC006265 TaxID=3156740 RepID=UPI0033B06BB5
MPATAYAVSGMSCGHCKTTLTKVIGELTGVSGVEVDLDSGHRTRTKTPPPQHPLVS